MKIGFIGCGNMASAMIGGIIKNQVAAPADILASAKTEVSREKKKAELGIAMTADNREVAAFAEVLILAVKPFYYEDVIQEIRDVVADDTIVVSIAPGKKLTWMEGLFEKPLKIVRTMPNTPALVGEGELCLRQCKMQQRRCGYGLPDLCRIWENGDRGRGYDRCGGRCKRKFTGVCIYVY